MHLLALGAFWLAAAFFADVLRPRVLMHLLALGAFWPSASRADTRGVLARS